MKLLVNDQLNQWRLIQEKQRIIKELKESKGVATIAQETPREYHVDPTIFFPVNEDMVSFLGNATIIASNTEAIVPFSSLGTFFDNISATLSTENPDTWVPSFFKDNIIITGKIEIIEKARFKIYIP